MMSGLTGNLTMRRVGGGMLLVLCGVLLGIGLNYYGIFMENIHMDMSLKVQDSANTTSLLHRLMEDLPPGYKLTGNGSAEDQFVVPNIVHFIWFGKDRKMTFINYISILSAHLMHKPDVIMFHCDNLPVGDHWERLWRIVPLQIRYRQPPASIYGQKLRHIFHQGDVAKLEILMEYGGIYLDYDVIVLRSMDPLRKYDVTLGKEKPPKFIAGIIIARKNAPFIRLWHESYKNNYRGQDWDYNCARVTYQLYKEKPELLHVEPYKLTTPDWLDRGKLWNEVIDWRGLGLYVIHIMTHDEKKVFNPDNIRTMKSTFGEVTRYIYYGTPEIRVNNTNRTPKT